MIKNIFLIVGLVSFLGCGGNDLSPAEEQILGKWQLFEYCVSPGSGNCVPQTATTTNSQTLEFKRNGSFIEKKPQPGRFQTPIVSSGDYQIKSKGKIIFRFDNQTAITGEVEWGYEVSATELVIYPLCFEGCKYTYTRM